MPPEGPNKAEELLQRYAKKRREQAPDFSLHPASRRVLQGEVVRKQGSSSGRKSSLFSWFGTGRSRVIFGVAAAAAILIVTVMIWNPAPTKQPMRMAKNEPSGDALRDLRSQEAARPKLAELEKQVAPLTALSTVNESLDSARSKEKALAGPQAKTDSLRPVPNLSLSAGPIDYYFADYTAISSTNVVTFDTAVASSQNLWATPPASPPLQLSYSLNGALADQRGFAPAAPRLGVPTEGEANLSSRLGRIVTNGVMLADTARYAKDSPATPLPAPDLASLDAKRFSEVAQVQLRSEAKGQAESFGVSLARSPVEEDLSRNRKLNFTQPAQVGTAAKPADNPGAAALGVAPAASPAEPQARVASTAIAGTFSSSPAGDSRIDFDGATAVFDRQSDLVNLPQVAQKAESLEKKLAAAPRVLDRFTIEQRGETFRILETDGSVYEGAIDSGLVAGAGGSRLDEARDKNGFVREAGAGSKSTNATARSYSFRAAGSNVTLRQNVVINGQLSAGEDLAAQISRRANGSSAVFGGGALSRSGSATAPAPVRPAPQPSPQRAAIPVGGRGAVASATNRVSTIEGTVRVGLTNEQRFRAVQAPR